jgi:hypothetical protein
MEELYVERLATHGNLSHASTTSGNAEAEILRCTKVGSRNRPAAPANPPNKAVRTAAEMGGERGEPKGTRTAKRVRARLPRLG